MHVFTPDLCSLTSLSSLPPARLSYPLSIPLSPSTPLPPIPPALNTTLFTPPDLSSQLSEIHSHSPDKPAIHISQPSPRISPSPSPSVSPSPYALNNTQWLSPSHFSSHHPQQQHHHRTSQQQALEDEIAFSLLSEHDDDQRGSTHGSHTSLSSYEGHAYTDTSAETSPAPSPLAQRRAPHGHTVSSTFTPSYLSSGSSSRDLIDAPRDQHALRHGGLVNNTCARGVSECACVSSDSLIWQFCRSIYC